MRILKSEEKCIYYFLTYLKSKLNIENKLVQKVRIDAEHCFSIMFTMISVIEHIYSQVTITVT